VIGPSGLPEAAVTVGGHGPPAPRRRNADRELLRRTHRSGAGGWIRQRASIPGGRRAGAAVAPGLGRKRANARLSIAESFPNLARGDARIVDRRIRVLRLSGRCQCRCGRRRAPVQHVAIRMIKFEYPRPLNCSLGKRRFRSQSRKSYCHRGNFVPDHIACSMCVREKLNLLLLMLWVADLLRTILFIPDPSRRLLRSSVRYARISSSCDSCQPVQVIRRTMTTQRAWTA
jgi:hypothetical protein